MKSKKSMRPKSIDPGPLIQNKKFIQASIYPLGYTLLSGLLLLASVAALYAHALWNPLILDDLYFFVQANLEKFGSSCLHLRLRCVSYATFGWIYELFGLDWFWYRLGNLALHALTSLLLFVFFVRLLNLTAKPQNAVSQPHWPAFFGALIFAMHPAAVYGVAYLVQRSIIMATLFGVAALLFYIEGLVRERAKGWFALSAVFYLMAVFSKEHSIMIPGVAAALTLLFHKPSFALAKKIWFPFLLYFLIAILITLLRTQILGTTYEYLAADMLSQLSHEHGLEIKNPYGLSVITQGFLFFKYLLLWIIPYTGWMSIDMREMFATHLLSWPQMPGFILFLAYPVLALRFLLKGGKQGLLGFGLLYPWILYLTELTTVRIQEPFVLYRSYLWMSGLPIILFGFINNIPRKLVAGLLVIFCLVLFGLAWNRLDTFSNDLNLWADAVEKNRDESLLAERGYFYRAIAYFKLGQIQNAHDDLIKAVTLNPKYAHAYLNLGATNEQLKNFPAALQSYDTAIKLSPVYVKDQILDPIYVLAHVKRSALFLQMGRNADALKDCEHVLQLNTQEADAYLNCGIARLRMGKPQEALHYLNETLRIDPGLTIGYVNRSLSYTKLGHYDAALEDLEQAQRIDPKDASIYYHRGLVYGILGRYQDAMQNYSQSIALDPNYIDAYINRGGLYVILQRLQEAVLEFDRAIQLNPNREDAYIKRGHIYAMQSRYQDALANYNQALKLNSGNVEAMQSRAAILHRLKNE